MESQLAVDPFMWCPFAPLTGYGEWQLDSHEQALLSPLRKPFETSFNLNTEQRLNRVVMPVPPSSTMQCLSLSKRDFSLQSRYSGYTPPLREVTICLLQARDGVKATLSTATVRGHSPHPTAQFSKREREENVLCKSGEGYSYFRISVFTI